MQLNVYENSLLAGLFAGTLGMIAGYLLRYLIGNLIADEKEARAKRALTDAERESVSIRKEGELSAKAEVMQAREKFETSIKDRRHELADLEERIAQKEANLERKVAMIDKKEHAVDDKLAEISQDRAELDADKVKLEELMEEERNRLQRVAGMTQEEARRTLLSRMEKEVAGEASSLIRRTQERAKETAERDAQKIVSLAIQRYSASHASETMTSSVALPSDEMKGRIIGREGRNIRAIESITGVNVLIDDTPEAVVISGFDPLRREIAKLSLEMLISDGRIHPARIEEVVEKVTSNMNETIRKAGEEAAYSAGVHEVDPEILSQLGRLKYRTSYSQNVLQHSIEVAQLLGVMAGEISLDVSIGKRVGLFHDIGKSMDHEIEGGHAVIGADFLKKQGEAQVVINAVAAHHEEVEAESMYAVLASAADAISCARPGARSETTGIYLKRLEKLEGIANGFDGVTKTYAIQAGREVRVIVEPEKIDDNAAITLARDISKKIESDLQYPGQVRVVVVRETRIVDYAR